MGRSRRIELRETAWGALAALVSIGLASPAAADAPRSTGFEPSIHVGIGTFSNGLTFDSPGWAPGRRHASIGVHIGLAYRFAPVLDAGVHVFHQWLTVGGVDPGAEATASGAGILARLHPLAALWPRLPFDVSFGVAFDFFASARQTTEPPSGTTATEERASVPGLALPVLLGIDVLIGDTAVGLSAVWAPWWRVEECTSVGTGLPECRRRTGAPIDYFFVGLGVRMHLEFVQ